MQNKCTQSGTVGWSEEGQYFSYMPSSVFACCRVPRLKVLKGCPEAAHMAMARMHEAWICRLRCLGDHDLKGAGGLTADPEVTSRDLDDKDTFVVAASDGLWDCISNEEAVNIVHDTGAPFLSHS